MIPVTVNILASVAFGRSHGYVCDSLNGLMVLCFTEAFIT